MDTQQNILNMIITQWLCLASRSVVTSTFKRKFQLPAGCLALLATIFALNSGQAAVWSWSGGGANTYWNNSANWGFAGIPTNGDTVIFPASQPNLLNTNNIAGLVLNQVRFAGGGGGYDIRGNAFTLTNGILATNTVGANTIENSITLSTATALIVVSNGVSLTLDGNLSGSVGVTKSGLGTLLYQCIGNNSYTGTTLVAGGTLQFNVSGVNAVSGPLVIGDGTGAGNPTVEDLQAEEMQDLPSVAVNWNGTLNLNNNNEPAFTTQITLAGGVIATGIGTLALRPNTTITAYEAPNPSPNPAIFGNLSLGGGTLTINGNLTIVELAANVSGSANIVQNGTVVTTEWSGNNTYVGNFTVNGNGGVWLMNSLALGNTNNNMTLNDQASVALDDNINVTNQSLTINSTNEFNADRFYSLNAFASSTNSWTANFTNNSGLIVDVVSNCAFSLNGPISGPGNLAKIDQGILTLGGNENNTYAGATTVSDGTLLLDKDDFAIAVPSPLVMGSNTTVRLLNEFQIDSFTNPVTMNDSSILDLNGFSEALGPLSLQGAQIAGNGGLLYLGADITVYPSTVTQSVISGTAEIYGAIVTINTDGHNFSPDLIISANLESGGTTNGLIKTGVGEVSLSGNNSFTGPVTINYGNLWAQTLTALGNANVPVTVFNGGTLSLIGSGLDFAPKPLVLNGSGDGTVDTNGYAVGALMCKGSSSWEGPITLSSDTTIYEDAGAWLTLNGTITGPGSYTKSGPGTNTFSGTGINEYLGQTTVNDGTLNLDRAGHSIGYGTLTIGDGVGPDSSAVVRDFGNNQIESSVSIDSDGMLDLNGHNDIVGPEVTLGAAYSIMNTSAGTLTLKDGTTLTATADVCGINGGYLNIGSINTTCTWVPAYESGLYVYSTVSGAAALAIDGPGFATLGAANSYTGPTLIEQGFLWIGNNSSLGATNNGVVVGPSASLGLNNSDSSGYLAITNKSLTLNGPGWFGEYGALDGQSGTNVWAGPVVVNDNSTLGSFASGVELHITGPISGPGALEVFSTIGGGGPVFFEGTAANTYAGLTTVDWGSTLVLRHTTSYGAVSNVLVGETLRLGNSEQIAASADVLVISGALFDFGPFVQDVNTLRGQGSVTFGANSHLNIGAAGGTSKFDGLMSGSGSIGGYTVNKLGTGTFTMTANNTYLNGTSVSAGKLFINGNQPQSPVNVSAQATLGGVGTAGPITASGIITPGSGIGNSSGILNSGNVTFGSTGEFTVALNGTNTGTSYSQLNVTGTVSLASAGLQVMAGGVGAVNSRYTIINNDAADSEIGIFNGLPEGATVTANNGTQYAISYQGGTGNDVVLTQISLPTPPQLDGIQPLAGGSVQLDGLGLTNLSYTVWANTNLTTTNWISIGTAATPANTNAFQFTDQNATNFPQRFYRFSWP